MFLCSSALATTYYVRPDGGTLDQCNGLFDSSYPDFSGQKNCALKHPAYIISPNGNNPGLIKGGDTVIIDPSSSYMIGYGMPNAADTSVCYSAWPWDCYLKALPSGTTTNPTRILGKEWNSGCTNATQLWGTQRVSKILNLNSSNNIELQCLDITDHSDCIEFGPGSTTCKRDSYPYGEWAGTGLEASDSSNILLKNVKIHGLAHSGIHAGRLSNWTLDTVDITRNAWVGWDGDIGANVSSNSGNLTFNKVRIEYNGCGEKYATLSPYSCWSQSQGGYGDGLGTHRTSGNWTFDNCDISHNTSDGLDLLYHDGNGFITIKNSRFEGNAGNQIKVAASSIVTNTYVDGDCAYFNGKSFTSTVSPGFDNCRAAGNSISNSISKAGIYLDLSTVTLEHARGDCGILTSGSTCNGTEYVKIRNSKFQADTEFWTGEQVCFKYDGGISGNGDGSCASIKLDASNYSAYNFKSTPSSATIQTVAQAPSNWGYQGSSTPPICVPDGSCSASTPSCGQTTTGTDNCGNTCQKTGSPCPCVPNGSCSAVTPNCEETTYGVDNCGNTCSKTGGTCACVPDGSCNAATPQCGQITIGVDNCGNSCQKVGVPCTITYISISNFESWLTTTSIQTADTASVIKYIKIGRGTTTNPYKYYKIIIEKTTP